MEKVPGGKYSTTQNSEHKDSVEMENRRSGHSKLKSGGPTLRRAERKETWETQPEVRVISGPPQMIIWNAHRESECQKQQTGFEKYWRQSVPALTLNKAISTSRKLICSSVDVAVLAMFVRGILIFFLLIVLYFLSDGCGILAMCSLQTW